MDFLYKSFVPFNAILLALLIVMLATADKPIFIYNNYISHVTILSVFFTFLLSLTEVIYGIKALQTMLKNIVVCIFVHCALLTIILLTHTPTESNALLFLDSYQKIYNPIFFLLIIIAIFIPWFIVNNNLKSDLIKNSRFISLIRFMICCVLTQLILSLYHLLNNTWYLMANGLISYSTEFVFLSVLLSIVIFSCSNSTMRGHGVVKIPNYYVLTSMLCVTLLLNSHSICYKFVELPLFGVVSGSGIMFPFTFLLADVVAEHYGYSASRTLIWSTLIGQFVFVVTVYSIYLLPASESWAHSSAFNLLFSNLFPRQILAASICVFFSFFIFSFLISILKTNLQRKKFWQRSLIANMLATAVLCFFSYMILYYGKYDVWYIIHVIINTWVLKMLIATIGTFVLTIPMIYYLKLNDQRAYRYGNNYNPFSMQLHDLI